MGLLVEGEWHDRWYDTKKSGGRFVRQDSAFRDWVKADGSTDFAPESGRYRLYVSYACPWAHRTLIFRKLKQLEDHIDVVVVDAFMGEQGWILPSGDPLYTVYQKAKSDYTGRVTVPTLWDLKRETIVNNESSELIRMLNSEFDELAGPEGKERDYYPEDLRSEIDAINPRVYDQINNGVYKSGFATKQDAYEEAVTALFELLDEIEERLAKQRYLCGDRITEADWRLFTTLVRFDPVYHGHFKCNLRRIVDYPNLWGYTRELYQVPGVSDTVHFDHIKQHYYRSHETVNPTRIVPKGPIIDFSAAHDRARLG